MGLGRAWDVFHACSRQEGLQPVSFPQQGFTPLLVHLLLLRLMLLLLIVHFFERLTVGLFFDHLLGLVRLQFRWPHEAQRLA